MQSRSSAESVETVVLGGGQAGLATGYHLKQLGLDHVILDENERVGAAWRNRWDSLRLFTPARYSALPGLPFPGSRTSYPTKDQTADYLEAYAAHFELPVRLGVQFKGVRKAGDRFEVVCGTESLLAENVVVASGPYRRPRIPEFAADLDGGIVQLHSSQYRRPSQLKEGGVLVVGAANSGAEIALEASRDHQVWLSGRDPGQEPAAAGTRAHRFLAPVMWFAASHVLSVKTPIGRKMRDAFLYPPRGIPLGRVRKKDFIAAGIERVPRTVGVKDGQPLLEDGRALEVANVIWCTGFDADFSWVELPIFGEYGWPAHKRGVVESEPGLYFMGLLFQYSLSSALIGGVGRDARYIARHIKGRRSGGGDAANQLRP